MIRILNTNTDLDPAAQLIGTGHGSTTLMYCLAQSMLAACGVRGPPPPPPEEVALWIRSQEVSSTRLKMAGHGPSVAAGLAALDPAPSSFTASMAILPECDAAILDTGDDTVFAPQIFVIYTVN